MKSIQQGVGYALVGLLFAVGYVSTSVGEEPNRFSSSMEVHQLRASQLTGINVMNPSGKVIAKVNDVVLDAHAGTIRYAAVSYGGFLGVGDKLFAVPWKAFEIKADEHTSKRYLILDVNEADLKSAEGFDPNHWPDFADKRFTDKVDMIYKSRGRIGGRNVDVDVNGGGVNVEIRKK